MTSARPSLRFDRLAGLQELVTLDRRRLLADACARTDERTNAARSLATALNAAEANLASIQQRARLCLDRWQLAAALVGDGAEELARGQQAVGDAHAVEMQAASDWLAARHRTEWLADRARLARKEETARRDEAALRGASDLRLALGGRGVQHED